MDQQLPLEDNYEDILAKASGGLGIGTLDMSERSGIPAERIRSLLDGSFNKADVLALSTFLGLDGQRLVDLATGRWYPEPIHVDGLYGYTTPYPVPGYEEMTVNSYMAHDQKSGEAVVFDTGADVTEVLADIQRLGLTLRMVLLTHTHGDHIKALNELLTTTGNPEVWVNNKEGYARATGFDAGKTFTVGELTIESHLTNGHSPGGTTYRISGLDRPVAIVGDSLFAGSQGGARGAYGLALENNRNLLRRMPEKTVICPGHGPLTTVAEEKAHNPFFPDLP